MNDIVYAFDLDGTITSLEILPLIARELNLHEELGLLTRLTLDGTIAFDASFRLRFHILKSVPVPLVQKIVAAVPLNPAICAFIQEHSHSSFVVTGNLDCWIEPLIARLGCGVFSSRSVVRDGVLSLESIMDKGCAVRELGKRAKRVVAIGESMNDIPMFEAADIGIAYGGVHTPVPELVRLADHVVDDGDALCRLLRSLPL